MDLPRYQSHKQVGALEISNVSGTVITFADPAFPPISVDAGMYARYTPTAGDYYVAYDNGYTAFQPRDAFLTGYSRVTRDAETDTHVSAVDIHHGAAGYSTAGMLAALVLCCACTLAAAKGNPAALAKYRAEKAAAGKVEAAPKAAYVVPSAGKWSKPAAGSGK